MFHNGNENSDMTAPERTPFLPIETITQAHNYQPFTSVMEYISAERFEQITDTIPEKL